MIEVVCGDEGRGKFTFHRISSKVSLKWHLMQIKTTMRYQLTPVRIAIIRNSQTTNSDESVEKREASYTVGRNVNWCSHYGKQYGDSLKN